MDSWQLQPARDHDMPMGKRMSSLQRESGLISTGLHIATWTVIRTYLAFWHRIQILGLENLPGEPPYILIANHSSHLDALVLASPLSWRLRDRVFPIAAGDVFFETPIMKTFSAFFLNALPMWRKKCGTHALQELRDRLESDSCVFVLFPEGGRSRDGVMMPFKKGLGMLTAGTTVPVVPCYLEGCFNALPADQCWPRQQRIKLRIGKALHFKETANDRSGWEEVTHASEAAVKALQLASMGTPPAR